MPHLAKIDLSPLQNLNEPVAQEKRLSGTPMTGTRSALENEGSGFYTGVWASTVGSWRVSYSEDELCVLLEGHVRLMGDDGTVQEFRKGDAFTIASGFAGIWETIEPARKIYAISLPAGAG